jgi:hypothetical protein
MGKFSRATIILIIGWMSAGLLSPVTQASELHPETVAAYDHYIQLTEQRMKEDLREDRFLYIDSLPPEHRDAIYAQLRGGESYIEQLHTLEDGHSIHVPDGLIHHWTGIIFIPGGTYSRTLAVLQDYAKYADVYKPDVRKSKLLEREGNIQKIYFQLSRKSLASVVLNADFASEKHQLSDKRAEIRSCSTRIAEVKDPEEPDEHELPVGNDHGYLWRLCSYWRVEQHDGGVYLQVESIALSRTIPVAIAWLVNPAVRKLSREVVANLLNATVKAVTGDEPVSH